MAVPTTARRFSTNEEMASRQPARGPWTWPPSGPAVTGLSSSAISPMFTAMAYRVTFRGLS